MHRLGLDSGESWFLSRYPDFAPRFRSAIASGKTKAEGVTPKAVAPARAQAQDKPPAPRIEDTRSKAKPGASKPAVNSSKLVPILAAVAVIALIVVLILVL